MYSNTRGDLRWQGYAQHPCIPRDGHGGGVANTRAETWAKLVFSWQLGNERLVEMKGSAGLEESRPSCCLLLLLLL